VGLKAVNNVVGRMDMLDISPFFTLAVVTSFSSLRLDFVTSSSGGLEYLISIS